MNYRETLAAWTQLGPTAETMRAISFTVRIAREMRGKMLNLRRAADHGHRVRWKFAPGMMRGKIWFVFMAQMYVSRV
jgi:hypothetical protein